MTSTHEGAPAPGLLYNPFDVAFRGDPYPVYKRMRDEAPAYLTPLGFVMLSRYADCVALLRHPLASSDATKSDAFAAEMRRQGRDPVEAAAEARRPFLFMDPPDHTRLRGLVSKAFTPRVIETLRPRIAAIVDELLAASAREGSIEVIEDLAYPLPVRIISEMLGVPAEDHGKFTAWSRVMARNLDPDAFVSPEESERRLAAVGAFSEYVAGMIAKRRADPGDDLVSGLIAAEDEGAKLTEVELISTCILLLIAGHETTVSLIGNGTLALLRHPDQLALLRDDPLLIRSAVEELLRYDPPVQLTGRNALGTIELENVTLERGQQAVVLLGSANRDERQFAGAEGLDIRREDNRHVAFGMGVHFCLGAPLARVEGAIAIGALASRLVRPELAGPPVYKENITLRGLASLPVSFGAVLPA